MNRLLIALYVLSLAIAGQAQAAGTGDMFGDAVWVTTNRPPTRSDAARTADMFADAPTLSPHGDLFQNAVIPISVRDDMLVVRYQDAPPSRIFSGWADR